MKLNPVFTLFAAALLWMAATLFVGPTVASAAGPEPETPAAQSQSKKKTAAKSRKQAAKRKTVRRRRSRRRRIRGQRAPTRERIEEIQAALAREGAYQGEPSGRWDAATVAAMKKFQAGHELNATGKLDALTLQKLGLGSPIAGKGSPRPPANPQKSSSQ